MIPDGLSVFETREFERSLVVFQLTIWGIWFVDSNTRGGGGGGGYFVVVE